MASRDRVRQAGTSYAPYVDLSGAAAAGYRKFSDAAVPPTEEVCYLLTESGGGWEVGFGWISSGSLVRASVLASSNAGALISLADGTPVTVSLVAPAALFNFHGAKATLAADVAVATGTGAWATVSLDAEEFDTDAYHATPGSSLAVPSVGGFHMLAGVYLVGVQATWAANSTGIRSVGIFDGSTQLAGSTIPAAASPSQTIHGCQTVVIRSPGASVQMKVQQTSGGNLNLVAGGCQLWWAFLKPIAG